MPKRLLEQKSSSSDSFNAISGLYRTTEPQEALWHSHPSYLVVAIHDSEDMEL